MVGLHLRIEGLILRQPLRRPQIGLIQHGRREECGMRCSWAHLLAPVIRDAADGCGAGGDGVDEQEVPVDGEAAKPTRAPLWPISASRCAAGSGVGGSEVDGPKCLAKGKGDGVAYEWARRLLAGDASKATH